jgi:hypothetical protein
MGYRSVIVSAKQYEQERLYAQDVLSAPGVAAGDHVVLVADVDPPVVFGLGRAHSRDTVRYTHRILDEPVPFDAFPDLDDEAAVAERVGSEHRVDADKQTWIVSLGLPIEAATPAEAVRAFWSYVRELGPVELPTYVAPIQDELAMQAYVLGVEANQDPEED